MNPNTGEIRQFEAPAAEPKKKGHGRGRFVPQSAVPAGWIPLKDAEARILQLFPERDRLGILKDVLRFYDKRLTDGVLAAIERKIRREPSANRYHRLCILVAKRDRKLEKKMASRGVL